MTVIKDAEKVAYSSIVGQSIMLLNASGACIGQLSVLNTADPDHIADQVVASLKAQAGVRKQALNEMSDFGQEFDLPPPHPKEIDMSDWTEPMKALCAGRCAEKGDPACWELPSLSSDCDGVEPCQQCQADRIAELEAENARLQSANRQLLARLDTIETMTATPDGLSPDLTVAVAQIAHGGVWDADALQENDGS